VNDNKTGDSPSAYEFSRFRFDVASGAVTHRDDQSVRSLSPQPAALLALLLDNAGHLVSHETIRDHLWPEARVEYDQGVHFCVRQIRSALGDAAKSPEFIETLAKRGYKFIGPASRISDPSEATAKKLSPPKSRAVWTGILLFALAATAFFVQRQDTPSPDNSTIAVAIMPMTYAADENISASTTSLALRLVNLLTAEQRLAIIGPTTTVQFVDEVALMRSVDTISVGYIINGRIIRDENQVRLLAELIRSEDGAHIWTRWYDCPVDAKQAAQEITAAVLDILLVDTPASQGSD